MGPEETERFMRRFRALLAEQRELTASINDVVDEFKRRNDAAATEADGEDAPWVSVAKGPPS